MRTIAMLLVVLATGCQAGVSEGDMAAQDMVRADCMLPRYECAPGEDCAVLISAEERANRMLRWAVLGRCEDIGRSATRRCTAPTCAR